MYGARAVLRWLELDPRPASLAIVWLPMVATDNAAEACSSATMFRDPRIVQFWDPGRLTGLAWSADFQSMQARTLLDSMPSDHEMRPFVEYWINDPSVHPSWDVAYFYPPKLKWRQRVPTPASWTKQVGFWGDGEEEPAASDGDSVASGDVTGSEPIPPESLTTGAFWTSRSPGGTLDSDWLREFQWGMDRIVKR